MKFEAIDIGVAVILDNAFVVMLGLNMLSKHKQQGVVVFNSNSATDFVFLFGSCRERGWRCSHHCSSQWEQKWCITEHNLEWHWKGICCWGQFTTLMFDCTYFTANLWYPLSSCISFHQVLVHKGESGVAWFSAKVLDINNDSACISYDSHTEGECAFILFTCPHRCGDEHFFSTMQL